jgi:HEAT repeat protein
MGRTELRGQVGQWIAHPNPEVRSAALRALSRLGRVPLNLSEDLLAALDDQTEFVRVQAAHAAKGLPQKLVLPFLYEAMGDRSWWVRRASAESLLRLGAGGRAALEKAARSHPDRFARDMSAQVLADSDVAVEDRRSPIRAQRMEVPA